LNNMRWRRACGIEAEFEVVDDFVYDAMVFDEGDDSHSAIAIRTEERIHFIDLADHLCPAFPGRNVVAFSMTGG